MENEGVGIVGLGRIGMPTLFYHLRLDVPVHVVTEIPNLGGRKSIDTLVEMMNSEDVSRGRLPWEVSKLGDDILGIRLNGSSYSVRLVTPKDPSDVNWKNLGISFVEECSGMCTTNNKEYLEKPQQYLAEVHFQNGAHTVVVSAPTKGEDGTFVYGINESDYDPSTHRFISNASCTTKAVAFPLAVLYDNGLNTVGNIVINTTHAATGPTLQKLKAPDYEVKKGKIEEASSGAYSSLSKIFNRSLIVKVGGCEAYAFRVPTLNGSVAVVSIEIDDEKVSARDINEMFRKAAKNPKYHGGIEVYEGEEALDSQTHTKLYPMTGHIPSSVVSPSKTFEVGTKGRQFVSWYNNEDAPPLNQTLFTKYALEKIIADRKVA